MKFSESGLSHNRVIEEAFNFSQEGIKSITVELLESFTEQVNTFYADDLEVLNASKKLGEISDEEYEREKAELARIRDTNMKMLPRVAAEEAKNIFRRRSVAPALEIQNNSEKSSPELVAAAILAHAVRSPVDYQKMAAKFGPAISGLVADLLHIEAYPSERAANLAAAGSDTKRVFLAQMVSELTQILEQAEKLAKRQPPQKIMFKPGQEQTLFGNVKVLWGNDKKLDQRMIEVFNSAARITTSPYKIELDAKGKLELVQGAIGTPIKKPRPKGPKGPIIGDDEF